MNKLYPKLRGFLMGLIEILEVFSDTPCNIQIFSDFLENSKGSNISFGVEKSTLNKGLKCHTNPFGDQEVLKRFKV